MNYEYEYEITPLYSWFMFGSEELQVTLIFYIDSCNYEFSSEIVLFVDKLLIELGFVPFGV